MFVNLMNGKEKEKFLELIYKTANCDQNYAEEEEELINNYKIELGLTEIPETDSLENLIQYFKNSEKEIKKIVFFELYGMVMADGALKGKENDILFQMKEEFALDQTEYESLINSALGLQKAYDAVYAAIFD